MTSLRPLSLAALACLVFASACSIRVVEGETSSRATSESSGGATSSEGREPAPCNGTCVAGNECAMGQLGERSGTCGAGMTCCANLGGIARALEEDPPMLVEVDTGATMSPAAGKERALFVEYAAGGRWRLRWTCDAPTTCDALVMVEAATGMSDLETSPLPEGSVELSSTNDAGPPTSIVIATKSTSELRELSFSSAAGAEVKVWFKDLRSVLETPSIYFVLDGERNGGFEGELTSPVRLVPRAP